jgi:hypothetical protein
MTDLTLERMQECLDRWEAAGDARAVFLGCYTQMTANMAAGIAAGEFYDPAWVKRLLVNFAGYYFDALDAYDAGSPVSPVWTCAYEAADRPGVSVLLQLLLGVNAHINYDLVLATADVLEEEWANLSPAAREQRQADYDHVNEIISRTIDVVQDEIIGRREPALAMLDMLLGPLDEWMVQREITRWRNNVWDEAIHRVSLADLEARELHRQAVEAAALAVAGRFGG